MYSLFVLIFFMVPQVLVGGLTGSGEFPLEVPRSVTGAELKTSLYQLLGVVPCKQVSLVNRCGQCISDTLVGSVNSWVLSTVMVSACLAHLLGVVPCKQVGLVNSCGQCMSDTPVGSSAV